MGDKDHVSLHLRVECISRESNASEMISLKKMDLLTLKIDAYKMKMAEPFSG